MLVKVIVFCITMQSGSELCMSEWKLKMWLKHNPRAEIVIAVKEELRPGI